MIGAGAGWHGAETWAFEALVVAEREVSTAGRMVGPRNPGTQGVALTIGTLAMIVSPLPFSSVML